MALTETDRDVLGTLARAEGGASPIAWAIGTIATRTRLSTTERTVLLAVAALAARDLSSPDGYNGVTAHEVAQFLGFLDVRRARSNLIRLASDRELLDITNVQGETFVYRLPERAFNLESHPSF